MHAKPKSWDRTIWTLSIVASLICANVVGLAYFGRLDWTADKQFTLSQATKKALASLPEPVTIRAYFTADLPPPYGTQTRYVRDLLDAYYAAGRGKIRFEFIDPGQQISVEHEGPQEAMGKDVFGRTVNKPTAMEQELEAKGIVPVQVRVNASDKLEVKRAFMGMALSLGEKQEVIPVITETTGLEYDLTTLLRKMSRHDTQRLGVLTGHDGVDAKAMGRAMGALSEMYAVSEVSFEDVKADENPLEGLDALLVVGPKNALSPMELGAIRGFIGQGHAVGLFAGPVQSDLQTLTVTDNAAGLDTLFAELGVEVQPGLVLDAECATLNVQQQAGFMRVAQPVNYPFVGQSARLDSSHVTSGLDKVMLPFMGPVAIRAGGHPDVKSQMWVQSSPKAWVQAPPFDLNPMQRWTPDPAQLHAQGLVVALEGPLMVPPGSDAEATKAAGNARVVIAAGHDFLLDTYLQKSNEALLLNMADWLMHDDDLLAVRTRGLSTAPLAQVSASKREAIKLGNIVGLPMAFVALGLMRWRRRENRRQTAGFIVAQAPQSAA